MSIETSQIFNPRSSQGCFLLANVALHLALIFSEASSVDIFEMQVRRGSFLLTIPILLCLRLGISGYLPIVP